MKRLVVTEDAAADLRDIASYLTDQAGLRIARYVLGRLQEGMRFVALHPSSGHIREDLTSRPLRFWSVFSYLVVYDPATQPVQVIRVIHAHRDVRRLIDRSDD